MFTKDRTGSDWDIKYHPVNHSINSLGPSKTSDARKNWKRLYAFVYNTAVVRYLYADLGKFNEVEDKGSVDVRFAWCSIVSNFCSNELEFISHTVHSPPTNKRLRTCKEIQDLDEKIFQALISTIGGEKVKSRIFLLGVSRWVMHRRRNYADVPWRTLGEISWSRISSVH